MLTKHIPTAEEQLIELLRYTELTSTEITNFKAKYDSAINMCGRYIPEGDGNYEIDFSKFQNPYGGHQIILEGAVKDLGRPVHNSYNWHLQNTSQWLFAFGLLFDISRRDFSLHTQKEI